MKKLVAFILVLALCLSLCTVTAFADTIDSLTLGYSQKNYKTGSIAWEDSNDLGNRQCTVFLWGGGNKLYTLQLDGNYYDITGDEPELIDISKIDLSIVDTAQYIIYFNLKNTGKTFDNDFSLTINDTNIEEENKKDEIFEQAIQGYHINNNRDQLTISLIENIENESPTKIWDYETLAKGAAIAAGITVVAVGTIHTVKAIKNYKAEKAAAAEAAKLAEMPMVAFGDSGDAVMTLQSELNAQGYACGEADGVFGQNTLNAVIAFQTAKGLTADGVVGAQTWGALL